MRRRLFFKEFASIWFVLVEAKRSVSAVITNIFYNSTEQGEGNFLTIRIENKPPVKLPVWSYNKLDYISAFQLAKNLGMHTYFNDEKRKIVLYFPENRIILTANNAFIIIDEKTYQMPAMALWHNNEIYLPAKYFFPLLSRRTSIKIDYESSEKSVQVTPRGNNITGISIASRENGTVIRINTLKSFKDNEITADIRYGWLHVDFYAGKIDPDKLKNVPPAGIVKKLKTFQFSELASLAFQLRTDPLSIEIINESDKNEVSVVLRTREEIESKEITELQEEKDKLDPPDEVKRQLEEERRKWLIDVVIIDPGHGGKDPGVIGIGKIYEKDIVLPIAQKLGKIIKDEIPEVKIIYTRNSDKFVPLRKRTEIANENNGKVFISIHANGFKNKRASGFETYILGPEKGEKASEVVLKENSVIDFEDAESRKEYKGINQILATMAQNAFSRQSEYLASLVQQELNKEMNSLKMNNRGVKQGPFWVMVGATMPNILIETGYLTNSYDVKILKTSAYQYKIAQGIFNGLKRYKTDYESTI
jgi:N-acetylmuramoyl-L-alanine amidase